jgi:hypothetical protein
MDFLVNQPLTVENIRAALDSARLKPRRGGKKLGHRRLQQLIKVLPKPKLNTYLKRRMKVLQAATTGKLLPEVRLFVVWIVVLPKLDSATTTCCRLHPALSLTCVCVLLAL